MSVKLVDFAVVAVPLDPSSLCTASIVRLWFPTDSCSSLMGHMRLLLILAMAIVEATVAAEEDSPRIKRKPPNPTEAAQIASDVALTIPCSARAISLSPIAGSSPFVGSGQTGSATISCRCLIRCPDRKGNSSGFSGLDLIF
jgi:hypothetical protein